MSYNTNQASLPMLQKQQKTAQYMLLATVIATIVDIALLLANASLFIPYCAASSYYLTNLGFYFDGYALDTYTATGMVMSFVVLAVWLLVWWKSKTSRAWLKAGVILVIVDTVFLALFALLFLESPASCLWEGLLHIAVIYEMHVGLKACQQIEQITKQPAAPAYEPWDLETPTDSEYSDELE